MSVLTLPDKEFLVVSTTATDLHIGAVAHSKYGTKYVKCQAVGAIASGLGVSQSTVTGGLSQGFRFPAVLAATAALNDQFVGFNMTGVTLAAFDYFWAMVGPIIQGATVQPTIVITTGVSVYAGAAGVTNVVGGAVLFTSLTANSGGGGGGGTIDLIRFGS